MAVSTGDIKYCYPLTWPSITGVTDTIGGNYNASNQVNITDTGLFPTGTSTVLGGANFIRYSKVFILLSGTGGTITNPLLYITNESVNDQITMAPDPFWLKLNSAQTGVSAGRGTLPNHLTTGYFTGYTYENPLNLSLLSGNTYVMTGNSAIGVWLKLSVQPGLSASSNNTFAIGIRGEST